MSRLTLTKSAAPPTPPANKLHVYADSADKKLKTIDDAGVINVLVNDGLQDRNIITNGGFAIQQRMAVASTAIAGLSATTRAGQVADRWAVNSSVASNLNWQQVDTGGAPELGLTCRFYGSIIAASAGKKVLLSQVIINAEMAHFRGQKVRVSIKTSQKVGAEGQTLKLGLLHLTQAGTADVMPSPFLSSFPTATGSDPVWGANLAPIAPDASPAAENGTVVGNFLNFTSSLAWKRASAVFTVPSNARNLVIVLFSDATGGATDNISVAEAQLTQGLEILEYREPPIAETLLRCQRFFCKSFPLAVVPAAAVAVATGGNGEVGFIGKAAATALAAVIQIRFPTRMQRTPTLTLFAPVVAGSAPYRLNGTTPAIQTAPAVTGLLDMGAVVTATGDAAGAIGDMVGVHYAAEAEFIT